MKNFRILAVAAATLASAVALATQLTEAYLSLLGQFDRR